MLVGVAVCHDCGGPMYRLRAQNVRKDGSKQYNVYYRCWGSDTSPSKCRNMFPLEELDAWVEAKMSRSRLPRYEVVVTPGHGYEDEIFEVEQDLRELDLDDPDYDTKHVVLRAERTRLRSLPATPDKVERRKSGDTIGRYWSTLKADADKREFLTKLGVVVRVRRGKNGSTDLIVWELRPGRATPESMLGGPLDEVET